MTEVNLAPVEAQPRIYFFHDNDASSGVYRGKGFEISGPENFQVTAVVRYDATSDGTLLIPANKLGKEYIISSYSNRPLTSTPLPSEATIVATEDNTRVTITAGGTIETIIPLDDGGSLAPGDVKDWRLDKGDVLLLMTNGDQSALSGTKVEADKNVAVFSGHYCADIPVGNHWCEYNLSQDSPTELWGNYYIVNQVRDRVNSGVIRIFAKEDNTRIYRNGQEIAMIPKGMGGLINEAWIDMRLWPIGSETRNAVISSDKPISVSYYNQGIQEDQQAGVADVNSDPFQANLTPVENFVQRIVYTTPGAFGGQPFSENYLTLVLKTNSNFDEPEDVIQIGQGFNNNLKSFETTDSISFIRKGTQVNYIFKELELPSVGSFIFESDSTDIYGFAYGYANYDSYGYDLLLGSGLNMNDDLNLNINDENQITDSYIKLHPNPADEFIEIELKEIFSGDLNIYNNQGVLVYSQKLSGKNLQLNLESFAEGVYFLELINDSYKVTKKFIKN